MPNSKHLSDYSDPDKLKQYDAWTEDDDAPVNHTRYYTYYSLIPSLKDKVVLDIPCGLGHKARNAIIKGRAKKVIAVDIVQEQIDISKQKDVDAGIEEGQIEYVVHDATVPKVFSETLANVCLCVHLFCFAHSFEQLKKMTRCVYDNLVEGGECYIIICSLNKDHELVEKLAQFDIDIIEISKWEGNNLRPRKFNTSHRGFNYDVWAWEYEGLVKALEDTGFRSVSLHPYQINPAYHGGEDIVLYNDIFSGQVVIAKK